MAFDDEQPGGGQQDTVTMFAPNGSTGQVRRDRVNAALQNGGERAVQVKAPNGSVGWVRESKMPEAVQNGGTLLNPNGQAVGSITPHDRTWLERGRDVLANSAVGHSLEQTLPAVADALNLHPSETVNSPTYEQDKGQLLAPQYLADQGTRTRGALTTVGALTTPGNLITAAAGGAAAGALPAIAQRLISGGFTAQMVKGLYDQHAGYRKAVDSGDTRRAQEIQGEMGANGILAFLSGKHAVTGDVHAPAVTNPVAVADAATTVAQGGRNVITSAAERFKASQAKVAARRSAAAAVPPEPGHLDTVIPGDTVTPRQRFQIAKDQGVNLDLAQATNGTPSQMAKRVVQHSLTGHGPFEENTQANIDALHAHAASVLDDFHPEQMSREQFGNMLRDHLQAHQQKMMNDAGDLYSQVDEAMQGKTPDTSSIRSRAQSIVQDNDNLYRNAPELLKGPAAGAFALVKRLAEGPKDDGSTPLMPPQYSWSDLQKFRSDLLSATRDPKIVGSRAEGWLKQMTGAIDDAMTDAPKSGMPAAIAAKFRKANDIYSEMKQTYDTPQSRLYSMVRNADGTQVANAAASSTPHQFRILQNIAQELGEDSIVPALRRQMAERLLNPEGNAQMDLRNLPTRMKRTQKEALGEILTPDQVTRLQNIARTSQVVHADSNPSGTAKVVQPAAEISAVLHPATTIPALAGMVGERIAAKAMTNPDFVAKRMAGGPEAAAPVSAAEAPPAASEPPAPAAPAAPIPMPPPAPPAQEELPLAAAPQTVPETKFDSSQGKYEQTGGEPVTVRPAEHGEAAAPNEHTAHPAGTITGIDQEAGLPIVDRGSKAEAQSVPKGSRVEFPDGAQGTLEYHYAERNRARIRLDDGRQLKNADMTGVKVLPAEEEDAQQVGGSQPATAEAGSREERAAAAAPVQAEAPDPAAAAEQPGERSGADTPPVASVENAAPTIQRTNVADLQLDPKRFQYKLNTSPEGVTDLLKGKRWNDDLSGIVSVWKDPEDGKTYVVNGHHRVTLAKEAGVDSIAARYLNSPDAEHARGVGALQNIAEGRGTPMDAAKFMRDTGTSPEQLDKLGISMGEATARNGVALSRLNDSLFDDAIQGKIKPGRAIAIGEAAHTPEEQEALVKMIRKAEMSGRRVTDDTIQELGRMVRGAETHESTQETLFGAQTQTKNLALEKAEASAYIRQKIAEEKRVFGSVSDAGKAAKIGTAGNVIDAEKNAGIAHAAGQALELYDRLSTRRGTIDDALNEAAHAIAEKKNVPAAKATAYEKVRQTVSEAIQGTDRLDDRGVPPTSDSSAAESQPEGELRSSAADLEAAGQSTLLNRAQVQTPEFKRWFGDSKVVDSSGQPAVVYHGTNDKFTKVNFRKGAQGLFWFASDRDSIANGDAGAQGTKNIMPLYAKIENPAGWREYDKYSADELEQRGYDGVILPEKDGSFNGFIFKEASQVKSADRNRGTFDPSNPSILASRGAWKGSTQGFDVYPAEGNHAPMLHAGADAAELLGQANKTLAGSDWGAAAMRKDDVDSAIDRLHAIAVSDPSKAKMATDLADALNRARDKEGNAIVVRPGAESAVGEEQFHAFQHRSAAGFGDVALQVGQSPVLKKAQAHLAKEYGYPDDPAVAMLETTAKAANGDWTAAGLTLDEAADFFHEFLGALVKVRGKTVLNDMPKVAEELYGGRNGDSGQSDGGGPAGQGIGISSGADGPGSAAGGKGVQNGVLPSAAQASDKGRASEASLAEKLRGWAAQRNTAPETQGTLFQKGAGVSRSITTRGELISELRKPNTFVRWQNGGAPKPGRGSLNHGSKTAEGGLSVNDPTEFGGNTAEYMFAGKRAFLVRGDVVGKGGDGEPLLDKDTFHVVGEIHPSLREKLKAERSLSIAEQAIQRRIWDNPRKYGSEVTPENWKQATADYASSWIPPRPDPYESAKRAGIDIPKNIVGPVMSYLDGWMKLKVDPAGQHGPLFHLKRK